MHKKDGNYLKAFLYKEKSDSLLEVTRNAELQKQLLDLQNKYENDKLILENKVIFCFQPSLILLINQLNKRMLTIFSLRINNPPRFNITFLQQIKILRLIFLLSFYLIKFTRYCSLPLTLYNCLKTIFSIGGYDKNYFFKSNLLIKT